jgi:hypothetical protein
VKPAIAKFSFQGKMLEENGNKGEKRLHYLNLGSVGVSREMVNGCYILLWLSR